MEGRSSIHVDGLCAQGGIGDAVLHLLKLAGQGAPHPALSELSPAGLISLLQVAFNTLLLHSPYRSLTSSCHAAIAICHDHFQDCMHCVV